VNGFFRTTSVADATAQIFRYLQGTHVVAGAVILVFGGLTATAMSVLLFVSASACVNQWGRYRRSPFALIGSVGTGLYFVLPLTLLAVSGASHEFGSQMGVAAATQEEIANVAPSAIVYLTVLFVAGIAGLCIGSTRREPKFSELMRNIRADLPIGLLALVVLLFTNQALTSWLTSRVGGVERAESLWQFIFIDAAYLMLVPIVFYFRLSSADAPVGQHTRWRRQFGLILLLFFLQGTLVSFSKGAILNLLMMSFVLPLSYFQSTRKVACLMPTRSALVLGVMAAVVAFFLAQQLRGEAYGGGALSVGSVMGAVSSIGVESAGLVGDISRRIGAAVDAYILIFESQVSHGYSVEYGAQFGTYLKKNFANLVWMGTPYPEAYAPSSNLLPSVLAQAPLEGDMTKIALSQSLNTQPYTLFGVGLILWGGWAPLFVFAVCGALAVAYRVVSGVSAHLALIYLYNALVHSYGFEVTFANAMHMGVSLVIFLWLMRWWQQARSPMAPGRRPTASAAGLVLP